MAFRFGETETAPVPVLPQKEDLSNRISNVVDRYIDLQQSEENEDEDDDLRQEDNSKNFYRPGRPSTAFSTGEVTATSGASPASEPLVASSPPLRKTESAAEVATQLWHDLKNPPFTAEIVPSAAPTSLSRSVKNKGGAVPGPRQGDRNGRKKTIAELELSLQPALDIPLTNIRNKSSSTRMNMPASSSSSRGQVKSGGIMAADGGSRNKSSSSTSGSARNSGAQSFLFAPDASPGAAFDMGPGNSVMTRIPSAFLPRGRQKSGKMQMVSTSYTPVFNLRDLRDHPDWPLERPAFTLDLVREDLDKLLRDAKQKFGSFNHERLVLRDELRRVDEKLDPYLATSVQKTFGLKREGIIQEESSVGLFLHQILFSGEKEDVMDLTETERLAVLKFARGVHDYWRSVQERCRVLTLQVMVSDNLVETEMELAAATVQESDLQILLHSEELHSYPASTYIDPHNFPPKAHKEEHGGKFTPAEISYEEMLTTRANPPNANLSFRRHQFLNASEARQRCQRKVHLLERGSSDLSELLRYVALHNTVVEPSVLYKPFDFTSDQEFILERYVTEEQRARAAGELRLLRRKAEVLSRILDLQNAMRTESTTPLAAVVQSQKTLNERVMIQREARFVEGGGIYSRTLLKNVDQDKVQGVQLLGGVMQASAGINPSIAQFQDPREDDMDFSAASLARGGFYQPDHRYEKKFGKTKQNAPSPDVCWGQVRTEEERLEMAGRRQGIDMMRALNTVNSIRRKAETDELLDRFYKLRIRDRKRTGLLSDIEEHQSALLSDLTELEGLYSRLILKLDLIDEEVVRLERGGAEDRSEPEQQVLKLLEDDETLGFSMHQRHLRQERLQNLRTLQIDLNKEREKLFKFWMMKESELRKLNFEKRNFVQMMESKNIVLAAVGQTTQPTTDYPLRICVGLEFEELVMLLQMMNRLQH
ncbi:unnamed protein product [Amoebophrya sp. A120]|nr:unnamed protein product [Amoebophrya sp. A120]|eukprot:GSA120T00016041001.1